MGDKNKKYLDISRRSLIGGAAVAGAAATLKGAGAVESNPDNLPPNISEWTPYLGDGVDANPYGMPSEHESHVWL